MNHVEGNVALLGKLASVERKHEKERKMHKKLKSLNTLNAEEKMAVRGMVGKMLDKY